MNMNAKEYRIKILKNGELNGRKIFIFRNIKRKNEL